MRAQTWLLAVASLVALPRLARAQDAAGSGADAGSDEPTPAFAGAPALDPETAARLDELEHRADDLEREQRRDRATRAEVKALVPLEHYITAFLDVGAFSVGGNGSGIRSDIGHAYYPEYAGKIAGEWVFMGDPSATAINSNGDPADTSSSREDTSDTLRSGGRPSLLVNSLGLEINRDVLPDVAIRSLVEFLPRPGQNVLDVELANIEYRPLTRYNLVIAAGKVDSVLGVEYRSQDAVRRVGVAPSLICRYTCGRPLGVEARLIIDAFSGSALLADSSTFEDRFEPHATLHPNALPTASAHLQWMLPVGQGLELGTSGAYGAQDDQPSTALRQWHYGFDARLRDLAGYEATAEFVQGRQPGADLDDVRCGLAPCLTYKGAYVLVDRIVASWLVPYVRVDWRSAVHESGTAFVYESHTGRATVGAHFAMTSRVMAKAEFTYVRELGATPQFPDNVLTTSVVVATD